MPQKSSEINDPQEEDRSVRKRKRNLSEKEKLKNEQTHQDENR
jgi:hypothetical protein